MKNFCLNKTKRQNIRTSRLFVEMKQKTTRRIYIPPSLIEKFRSPFGYSTSTLPDLITQHNWSDWGRWIRAYRGFAQNHHRYFRSNHPYPYSTEDLAIRAFLKLLHPHSGIVREDVPATNKLIWVDHLMRWYFRNYRRPFVPSCLTLPSFCRKFPQIESAYFRDYRNYPQPPAQVYEEWRWKLAQHDPESLQWFLTGGPLKVWQSLIGDNL